MGNCIAVKDKKCAAKQPRKDLRRIKSTQDYRELKRQYKIGAKVLGAGSFGRVLLGTNLADETMQVAIKLIDRRGMAAGDLASIDREVELMGTVDHPNICSYFETYDDKADIYLVMELCTGGDIIQVISEDSAKQNELFISLQALKLLKALQHCHAQNIIHRDIKPENIMFGADGEVRLVDFGFALVVNAKKGEHERCGTPHYIAPEVLGGDYNRQCDVWSLGVSLFQILTGDVPFTGDSPRQVFQKIRAGNPEMPANLTPACQDLLRKMLVVDPKKRITVLEAIQHPWIKQSEHAHEHDHRDCESFPVETVSKLKDFKGESLLKRAAINLLAKHLDQKDLAALKQEFEQLDQDKGGYITQKELTDAIKKSNLDLSAQEVDGIIHQVDFNGNHQINYTEFMAATIDVKKYLTQERLESIFRTFDVDGSGKITPQNIKDAFSKFGREVSDEEIQTILQKHDLNHQESINLEEFKTMLLAN